MPLKGARLCETPAMQSESSNQEQRIGDRVRLALDPAEPIARVLLSRPDKRNAMDFQMLDAVVEVQRRLRRERGLRAVVLGGEGQSFCAGLDVKSVFSSRKLALLGYLRLWSPWRNRFQHWSLGWRDIGCPVIAAVQGHCLGAGMQLALGADVRIASPDARFAIMESKWGLVPDMGGTVLLRELMPIDQAKLLTWSARMIDAAEAQALGLITRIEEDPQAAALALARDLATRSPDAVAAGKFLLQTAWSASEWGALAAERGRQRQMMVNPNQRVAVKRETGAPDTPWKPRRILR